MATAVIKRDVSLRPVGQGKYILTQPGKKQALVDVIEDDVNDLFIRSKVNGQEVTQRLDELADDVSFHRIARGSEIQSGSLVDDLNQLLADASSSRQHLRILEDEVNGLLGSQSGDGSELADAVMGAVRDGVGSAIELADLAGRLRR